MYEFAELLISLFILVFGLAFFMLMMWWVGKDADKSYDRRLMEAREFGFGGKGQHDIHTLRKK